jgi:hypothetical protein
MTHDTTAMNQGTCPVCGARNGEFNAEVYALLSGMALRAGQRP